MTCYNCGCKLTEHNFCTNCGADVKNYKLVVSASNIYYNEGLEKAKVRDLTGAIASLRQCIKLNRNHVDARNLLGLLYFEIGECVQAMNEWVVSKNVRAKKNIADDYLNLIQSNPGKRDALNTTIRKYNQALNYCHQGSLDLAVIQLKKVLSMNGKYLQAHQLLALLYLKTEEWGKAGKELEKILKIDTGNTRALLYQQELNKACGESENSSKLAGKRKNISEESYQYQSGNETIIQPINNYEKKGIQSIWNMVIGIIVGFAVAWFLVLPAKIQNEKSNVNHELRKVSEQLDVKTATINELESKMRALESEKADLQGQLDGFVGTGGRLEDVNHLLQAVLVYMDTPGNTVKIGEYLEKINPQSIKEEASEAFASLYGLLLNAVGGEIGAGYYEEGMKAYQNGDYETAVENLTKAANYDVKNQDAYFNLANAYRKLERTGEAIEVYEKIIEMFPSTSVANRSQSYLNDLKQE